MITNIPIEVLEAARRDGVRTPVVADWLRNQLERAGVGPNVSPADWPETIWKAYKRLREAHTPGYCVCSAAGLFTGLDIIDGQ